MVRFDPFGEQVCQTNLFAQSDNNPGSAWTPFNQSLQRRLFKGAVEGTEARYPSALDAGD